MSFTISLFSDQKSKQLRSSVCVYPKTRLDREELQSKQRNDHAAESNMTRSQTPEVRAGR
jgi:hypothetical protein